MNLPDAPEDERYTVVVRNLVLMCSIGIRRAEYGRKQRVRVSVALTATQEAGFSGDDRRRVINYEKVVAAIREIVDSGHIDLCEGFAARVCDACFADPRVGHVRVEVEKLDVFPRPSRSARSWNAAGQGEQMRCARCRRPLLVGIVNITADSFSDGGRFLDPAAAIAHARRLAAEGADIVELGAAASNVAAGSVSPEEEIGRLDPVLAALADSGAKLAVDTYSPRTQRFALSRGVACLNDIRGFPDPASIRRWPRLRAASSSCTRPAASDGPSRSISNRARSGGASTPFLPSGSQAGTGRHRARAADPRSRHGAFSQPRVRKPRCMCWPAPDGSRTCSGCRS